MQSVFLFISKQFAMAGPIKHKQLGRTTSTILIQQNTENPQPASKQYTVLICLDVVQVASLNLTLWLHMVQSKV